jgi:hypothetical protein
MTWQAALNTLLTGDATLVALVGTRLAPVRNKQGDGYPRVTWFEVVGVPQNSLDGWSGTDNVRLQFDVYATTQLQAQTIKDRIRALMAPANTAFRGVCITDSDGPVTDGLEIYRRVLEFSLWTL